MSQNSNNNTTNYSTQDILLFLIGIIVICYTTYQTARGYTINAGGSLQGWILAILIGLCLSWLAINMKQRISRGNTIGAFITLIFYLSIAFFSFIANFNTFYSEGTRGQIVNEHLETLQTQISKIKNEAFEELREMPDKVNNLKILIGLQIQDKAEPGWGDKTQLIADQIETLLGVPLTKPGGTPAQIAIQAKAQIDSLLKSHLSDNIAFRNSVEDRIKSINLQIETSKKTKETDDDTKALKDGANLYSTICDEVSAKIKDSTIFKCSPLSPFFFKDDEIGQIQYAIKSAKSRPDDAIIPIFQAALLDLILPFMILITSLSRNKNKTLKFPDRR